MQATPDKIWGKATGAVVSDNQRGAADADSSTALIGASIVIHK